MAFEVSLRITSESQLEAIKGAEQALKNLGESAKRAGDEASKVPGKFRPLEESAGKLAISQRQVGTAVTVVASQVGGLGPVASLTANAITTMALASGGAGLALGALATTVGLLVFRVQQARENLRELAERELAGIARETGFLKFEQNLKQQVRVAEAASDPLRQLSIKFDELRVQAEKVGPEAVALVNRLEQLTLRAERLRQGTDVVNQGFQQLGITTRLTKSEMESLAENGFKLEQMFQRGKLSADQFDQTIKEWAEDIIRAKDAAAELKFEFKGSLEVGDKVFGLFQEEFTDKAVPFRNELFKIKDALSDLSKLPKGSIPIEQFQELQRRAGETAESIRQQYGFEVPNSLKELQAQVDALIQKMSQVIDIKVDGSQADSEIERLKAELDELRNKASQPLNIGGLTIPFSGGAVSNPFAAFPRAMIEQINQAAQGIQPITIPVFTHGSPTLPFSDYFTTYAPQVIAEFSRRMNSSLTPTIDLSRFMSDLNSITDLAQSIVPPTPVLSRVRNVINDPRLSAWMLLGNAARNEALRERAATERVIAEALARGIFIPPGTNVFDPIALRRAARPIPGATGGGFESGGGGISGVNVTIDLRGAHITQELLDRQLIPRFEGILKKTTGQDVSFGVLS